MLRFVVLASVITILCCSCEKRQKEVDWEIEQTETIQYSEGKDKKFQIIYSSASFGLRTQTDTSLVIQTFRDTLLLEVIEYNLRKGDTTKWRHLINEFDAEGRAVREIDSVRGTLRSHRRSFYENGRLQRTETLSIFPDYNDDMQLIGADTTTSTSFNVYNEIGKCFQVISISQDALSSALTGESKYDTSVTHKQFNEQLLETGSYTITRGDTTYFSRIERDTLGREVAFMEYSPEGGLLSLRYEYDARSNRISELATFDEHVTLTLTEFDSLNRPVLRKRMKPTGQ